MSSRRLDGHIALVTGASSGLGRHFALTLARAGADVVLAARRVERLHELAGEIAGLGRRGEAVAMDVTDPDSIQAALEQAWARMGAIDILINNAGIVSSAKALEHSVEAWDQVIDTNLTGAFLTAQGTARLMAAAGRGGSIVNVASILGLRVAAQVAAYAVSKAGVIQMTKVLALELARHQIRVNALAPGYIETDLNRDFLTGPTGEAMRKRIPARRFGRPEDLDEALLLLAGPGGAYMTGSVITVDGGHTLALP